MSLLNLFYIFVIKLDKFLSRFLRKSLTVEELLVLKVMQEVQALINNCPFKYLLVRLPLEVSGSSDVLVNYIIKDGYLYVDNANVITNKVSQDIDLDKYCFKFNGKFKSFVDLEHYQFLFVNIDLIKKSITTEITAKKSIYRL